MAENEVSKETENLNQVDNNTTSKEDNIYVFFEETDTPEKVVEKINNANGITLDMTVDLMKSTNYKIRFIGEYVQCKTRYNNLHQMLVLWDAGQLLFTPDCPKEVLVDQKAAMGKYLYQLEVRSKIEKVPLPKI